MSGRRRQARQGVQIGNDAPRTDIFLARSAPGAVAAVRKFGVEDKAVFARLRKRICTFSSERTALANGVNGKRLYLMQDSQALSRSRPANPRVSDWLHYSGLLSSVIDPGITRLL